MTNFQQLREQKQKEAQERAAAKAKLKPQQSAAVSAAEIRARHKKGKRYTIAEIQTLRKAMKLDLSAQELEREQERAKRLADEAEGDLQEALKSDVPMLANAPTAPPIPVPPGEDRDHFLSKQRDQQIAERVDSPTVGANLDLPEELIRIYRLLMAYSQPRMKGQGEFGWRYVDIGAVGANPWLVLGIDQPQEPVAGFNLTDRRAPMPSALQRLEANRILAQGIEQLRDAGLMRSCGLFTEISLAGVP
jgi:hypothetical protein